MAAATTPVSATQLFRRNEAVETAPLQQDAILYHARINRFCILNRTSSFIWNRLQAPISAQQLASEITASFEGISDAEALQDVQQALSSLVELDLIIAHES